MISELHGELTYLLKVIVEPMPEIKLEPFKVELGKLHKEHIWFENTDDVDMIVICRSSHPTIFYPEFEKLIVPPRSKSPNWIIYKASSLEL